MSATCKTCRFWDGNLGHEDILFGLCCKSAPNRQYKEEVTIERRTIILTTSFPPTRPDNWCGEHAPKDAAP